MIKPITSNSLETQKYQLEYIFEITEYLNFLNLENSGNQYKLLKETIKSLSNKSIWLPISDENGNGEMLVRWISNVTIYSKSGKIKIKLDEYLVPYLFELKEKYLSYDLKNILNFKSKYSIRFYDILKIQYDSRCNRYTKNNDLNEIVEWSIDLEELKRILMISNDIYENFKDFRKKIIEIAQREINSLSDIEFTFEPITKGRKTVKINFLIKSNNLIKK